MPANALAKKELEITFLPPPGPRLEGYDRSVSPGGQQPAEIPRTFLDTMEVRERVFVREFNVPLENEFDADDGRCCHWVAYVVEDDGEGTGTTVTDGGGETARTAAEDRDRNVNGRARRKKPVGTLRLVPYPQEPHPLSGGVYVDGILTNAGELGLAGLESPHPASTSASITSGTSPAATAATAAAVIPSKDRPTDLHDGQEPYLKLGRLAVLPEYRGYGIAARLVGEAVGWMERNSMFFESSATTSSSKMGGGVSNESHHSGGNENGSARVWEGLVCVHSRTEMAGLWERWGFVLDPKMGSWMEEGMAHLGMFRRVELVGEKGS